MYLATLYVTLDLEPEVAQADRERVLRSVRDRLKQAHGSRATIRTDDDSAVVVALLDDHYGRARSRIEEIVDRIDAFGEARILTHEAQVFAWFDGKFQETADNTAGSQGADGTTGAHGSRSSKTIVYGDVDDDDFGTLPSQLSRNGNARGGLLRRSVRIPTRK